MLRTKLFRLVTSSFQYNNQKEISFPWERGTFGEEAGIV
jgi:hypothetical protein